MTKYIAVEKDGQIKKIPASLEADYVSAGWRVVGEGSIVDAMQ